MIIQKLTLKNKPLKPLKLKFWYWYPGLIIGILIVLTIILKSESFSSLKFMYEF